jgi:thiamine biosynthesis lipoprotein
MIAYRSLYAMGTRMEIVLPGADDDFADQVFYKIKQQLEEDEKMLSLYREDSEFSRINSNAAKAFCPVDEKCYQLLGQLLYFMQQTHGCFDPLLGLLKRQGPNIDQKINNELFGSDPTERMQLRLRDMSVMFSSPSVMIDSGGFGKGYALDNIKKLLKTFKIKNAFISFGDSSVLTLGNHPAGNCWKVGIRDLLDDSKNAWVFDLHEGSVSTSGNSFQNRSKSGQGHIFNPMTREYNLTISVVSVEGPGAMEAEILSTALFVADSHLKSEILDKFPQYKAVELVLSVSETETVVKELNA